MKRSKSRTLIAALAIAGIWLPMAKLKTSFKESPLNI